MKKIPFALLACACALAVSMPAAHAQTYPDKPVRLIVPWPPGGITDVIARAIGQRLSEKIGRAHV